MLQVGLVIGDADHQASALAQAFGHARKALAQRIARHQSAPQRMAEAAAPAAPSSSIEGTDVGAASLAEPSPEGGESVQDALPELTPMVLAGRWTGLQIIRHIR